MYYFVYVFIVYYVYSPLCGCLDGFFLFLQFHMYNVLYIDVYFSCMLLLIC